MAFLDDAGGYTPVPDKLVREYDFTTAYVWGKVWRYCQMANGTCKASHQTIADRAGMSRRALIKHLDILIEDGYIEDLTPDLKNRPHTYSTKKGEEKIKSTVQKVHSELDESANVAQPDETTMQNPHPHYAENAQPTMQNLHLKKDSLETLKETPNGVVGKPTRPTKRERAPAEQPGPKTVVKDKFLELTGLEMPGLKTDRNFWWSQFGEILRIAKDNTQQAIKIMTKVVKYMHSEQLPISGPKSIVNLCRSVASGQSLNGSRPEYEEPTEKPIAIDIATGERIL